MDLDVAIYMGLSSEDVKLAGGSKPLLEALWPMFSALKDPKRQTAVVNLDGMHFLLLTVHFWNLRHPKVGHFLDTRPTVHLKLFAMPIGGSWLAQTDNSGRKANRHL